MYFTYQVDVSHGFVASLSMQVDLRPGQSNTCIRPRYEVQGTEVPAYRTASLSQALNQPSAGRSSPRSGCTR